eukprot:COSAG04_NODE_937_length_9318_cov_6.549192_5_plen_99_part_00
MTMRSVGTEAATARISPTSSMASSTMQFTTIFSSAALAQRRRTAAESIRSALSGMPRTPRTLLLVTARSSTARLPPSSGSRVTTPVAHSRLARAESQM